MASEPSGPRRLHPSTLLFSIGRTLRNLIVPGALALFAGQGSIWELIFVVAFVLTAAHAVFRYLTLTWELGADEMVVKEGLFFRSERHVPYARIQNVDLVQNVFHRLFKVAEARLETASGKEPEAVLRVLTLPDIERIRAHVFERPSEEATAPEEDADLLVSIPTLHLVFLGMVVNRGFAAIGVGLGLLYEIGGVELILRLTGVEARVNDMIASGLVGAITAVLMLVVVGLAIVFGLSILWSLLRFHGFTLRRAGDDLRLSCGLLTKIAATIPRARIQALTIQESWLHRRFGFASIAAQTAGGSEKEEAANVLRRRFVPILPADRVPALVDEVLPGCSLEDLSWRPISARATRRIRRRTVVVIALLSLPALWLAPWALVVSLLVAVLAWVYAGVAVKRARYARTRWGLVWQRGVMTRKTTLVPDEKIQTVHLTSSPFDRRHDHATLHVDVAGGSAAKPEVLVKYLDADPAAALRLDLARAAARTDYRSGPRSHAASNTSLAQA